MEGRGKAGEHISLIPQKTLSIITSSLGCPGRLKPSLSFFLTRGPVAVLLLLAAGGRGEGAGKQAEPPRFSKGWSSAPSGRT